MTSAMKKIFLALILLVSICFHLPAQTRIVGHRGYHTTGDSYENTVSALRNCQRLGVYAMEFDVNMTSDDSLVVYSDGKKRGYFNMYTGKVVVKPTYSHAWVFSDGLASVDDEGYIKFIDTTGEVVFGTRVPYRHGMEGCVFHNNYCVMEDVRGDSVGLIDKQGDWELMPSYSSILPVDSFFVVARGREQAVLDASLSSVIPFMEASFTIYGDGIEATMGDHTIRTYSLHGEMTDSFKITDTGHLIYDTDEITYMTSQESYEYDEEGKMTGKTKNGDQSVKQAIANCRQYQAEYGWYGLLSPAGTIITPPDYSSITAIGRDLYLCKDAHGNGVILNDKGKRMK